MLIFAIGRKDKAIGRRAGVLLAGRAWSGHLGKLYLRLQGWPIVQTDPDFRSHEGLQAALDGSPIHRWLGFRILSFDVDTGTLVMSAPAGGNAARSDGAPQAHGGAIATLIDSAATFACCMKVERSVPTMNMRVDYLRPAAGPTMVATARVIRAGRTAALVDVDVESGGRLVAVGRCGHATGG